MTPIAMNKITQAEIDAMPMDEKLALSEALWDSIAASPQDVPTPDWHKKLLDESLDSLDKSPDDQGPWEDVKARLLNKT